MTIAGTKIINSILILLILIVLGFEGHLLTRAQKSDPESTQEVQAGENPEAKRCRKIMQEFMAIRRDEFGQFMNTHFRSAKPTSQLIDATMQRFALYRKEARERLLSFLPKEGSVHQQSILPVCEKILQEDFFIMKEMIRQHIVANAYAKKSTRLLDKYKEINQKLDRLNFTISQMFGYFGSLSQKLPCFPTQCSKG